MMATLMQIMAAKTCQLLQSIIQVWNKEVQMLLSSIIILVFWV